MNFATILGIIISGICTGGLYGLVSAAFSFQFGSLNIINFAYGSMTMLGMYATFVFIKEIGMDPILFTILFIVIYFLFGFVTRALLLKSAKHNVHIVVTVGLSLLIENLALFVWGAFPRTLLDTIAPTWIIKMGSYGNLVINKISILTLIVSVVILLGFSVFLKMTWLGMAIRAVVQQREVSYLMGIDSMQIVNIGFGVSFIMTAVASLMLSLQFTIEPTAGHFYQLIGFLVCLIAGMGNLKGGFYAGVLVGVVSTGVNVIAAQWHDPIVFILFVLILTFFPHGIFTSKKVLHAQYRR